MQHNGSNPLVLLALMQIVELTGLSWPAVRGAIDLYEAGGMAALRPKPRGKKSGEGRIFTPDQETHIQKLIVEKRPEQLKMEFALWTRAAVGQLIEAERRRQVSETVGFHAAKADQARL